MGPLVGPQTVSDSYADGGWSCMQTPLQLTSRTKSLPHVMSSRQRSSEAASVGFTQTLLPSSSRALRGAQNTMNQSGILSVQGIRDILGPAAEVLMTRAVLTSPPVALMLIGDPKHRHGTGRTADRLDEQARPEETNRGDGESKRDHHEYQCVP